MNYRSLLFVFGLCFSSLSFAFEPLSSLHNFVDVLNIEGGRIPKEKLRKNQCWANVGFVLDRPFQDNIDFDEWTNSNIYPLKESMIPSYNESQVHFAICSILTYYMQHAHAIAQKNSDQIVTIIVHLHRGTSGIKYLNLLEELLSSYYAPAWKKMVPQKDAPRNVAFSYRYSNVIIEFRYGYQLETLNNYESADIVISLSLVAGLNPSLQSSDIVMAQNFIPMDLQIMQLYFAKQYTVNNHIFLILDDLLQKQDMQLLDYINKNYCSPNLAKKHLKAQPLAKEQFKVVRSLQVTGNFNPKSMPSEFEIV